MTRKEFMASMFKSIFKCKTIEYFKTDNNSIEYRTMGTSLIKDCTYSETYKEHVQQMIISLFRSEIKNVIIDKGGKKIINNIKEYQESAKRFVISLLKFKDDSRVIIIQELEKLITPTMLNYIYREIIISEIFNIPLDLLKTHGDDDFQESEDKISFAINKYLYIELYDNIEQNFEYCNEFRETDDCTKRKEEFLKSLLEEKIKLKNSDMEIYYKSNILRNYIDIKEYIRKKNIELVNLDSETVADFKDKVVYRFTSECFFKYSNNYGVDTAIVTINYNKESISAVTSIKNWINQSIIINYIANEIPRYMTCYFIFDNGNVFHFLQIGEE